MSASKDNKIFINYLPEVKAYLSELETQDLWWTTVGMVGKINNENIDPQLLVSIVDTQKEFQNLRDIMIDELIGRYLNQANSEIMLKAQTVIDILIRNLFERTADVGFLATDDDLVEYMANPNTTQADDDFIHQRIQEYVAKYSVYDDILLVKPNGEVKAKLDKKNPVKHSNDPLIHEALTTKEDYVEIFRKSDLFPNKPYSLIYAKKIEQQGHDGKMHNLGVLCLSFEFDNEMAGILEMLSPNKEFGLMLLDDAGKIIASNNQQKNPVGRQARKPENMETPTASGNHTFYTTKTNGYQGFYGLPWFGHVELSSEVAFTQTKNQNDLGIEIPKDSPLYLSDLEDINLKVSTLLLIVILNGKIMSLKRDVKSFLPILDRFQQISIEIQDIFNRFIHHIHQVLIDTIQSKVAFSAALSVEVMDRNLYERANDCRWWALNSTFRQVLTKQKTTGIISSDEQEKLTKILAYINELYTVYTNIMIYDHQGKILAVSNPAESHLVNTQLPFSKDIAKCMKLNDTQLYNVSDFVKTDLYNDEYTYLYHAAIKSWDNIDHNVGGMALVFDSTPEFKAMLEETQPQYRNEEINKTTFSAFVDRNGNVISSTTDRIEIGSHLHLPNEVLNAKNGENKTIAWTFEKQTHLLGFKVSSGYREYKNGDGYDNDVIAIVATGI